MPDIYTHPNGYTVKREHDGTVILRRDSTFANVTPAASNALRDYRRLLVEADGTVVSDD